MRYNSGVILTTIDCDLITRDGLDKQFLTIQINISLGSETTRIFDFDNLGCYGNIIGNCCCNFTCIILDCSRSDSVRDISCGASGISRNIRYFCNLDDALIAEGDDFGFSGSIS